jgi:hypothetical protein
MTGYISTKAAKLWSRIHYVNEPYQPITEVEGKLERHNNYHYQI